MPRFDNFSVDYNELLDIIKGYVIGSSFFVQILGVIRL